MFAPVVKSVHLGAGGRGRRDARRPRRSPRARGRPDPPGVPGDRDRPAGRRGPGGRAPALAPRRRCRAARRSAAAIARARRRRAPAAVGRRRRARRGARPSPRSPSGSRRRCSPPTARPASSRRAIRAASACRRTPSAAGRLWDEADVVLAIGSDLDGVQTQNFAQPQPETLIAVSLEPTVNYRVDVQLDGRRGRRRPRAGRRRARARRPRRRSPSASPRARAEACGALDATALRFLDAIHFAVPADGVLVVDMCIPGYWLAGFHTPAAPRRLQVPLGWGTLGYAFPAALGAALAGAGPAVSISGDGGFLFACGELATMAQEQIPLTAVIVDDGGYGMLRYDQQKRGRRVLRRRPPHARLRRARHRLRHPRRDRRRPRRRLRRSARPRTSPTRPRRSSSPAPRPRSSRRRTPPRTGTADGSKGRSGGMRADGRRLPRYGASRRHPGRRPPFASSRRSSSLTVETSARGDVGRVERGETGSSDRTAPGRPRRAPISAVLTGDVASPCQIPPQRASSRRRR